MTENNGQVSGVQHVLQTLDMLRSAIHHERCQAAVECAAAIIDMLAEDDEMFARMRALHFEEFPDDTSEAASDKLRDTYRKLVPVLMHVAQKHEMGDRDRALQESILGPASVVFEVSTDAVTMASGMMPTLFDNPEETPEPFFTPSPGDVDD